MVYLDKVYTHQDKVEIESQALTLSKNNHESWSDAKKRVIELDALSHEVRK